MTVPSGSLLMGNVTPFLLEVDGRTLSSEHAVTPAGARGYMDYWIWDNPCADWQPADEAYLRIIKTDASDPRLDHTDTTLAALSIDGADLDAVFDPTSTEHTATADADTEQVTIDVTAADTNACGVDIVPADADPDAAGHQIDLGDAGAVAVISVTAADNATTSSHTLVIGRGDAQPAAVADVQLDGVEVEFDPNQQRYEADIPPGTTQTTLDLTPAGDSVVDGYVFNPGNSGLDPVADGGTVPLQRNRETLIAVKVSAPGNSQQDYYTIRLQPPDSNNDTPPPATPATQNSQRDTIVKLVAPSAATATSLQAPAAVTSDIDRGAELGATLDGDRGLDLDDGDRDFGLHDGDRGLDLDDGDRGFGLHGGDHGSDSAVTRAAVVPLGEWLEQTQVTPRPGSSPRNVPVQSVPRNNGAEPELSALSISPGTLAPTFAAATHRYTASVDHDVEHITVTPTAVSGAAAVIAAPDAGPDTAGHQVALNAGATGGPAAQTAILVVVTAGTKVDSYTVVVTRAAPPNDDATLSSLTISSGTLVPTFSSATTSYTATVENTVTEITITTATTDSGATIETLPADSNTDTAGHQISLDVGENVITTTVTAADDTTTSTYTATVIRLGEGNNDATLSSLTISSADLDPVFASGTNTYTASASNQASQVTVAATPTTAEASVVISPPDADPGTAGHQVDLARPGYDGTASTATVAVAVTSSDGSTRNTYVLTVSRAGAAELGRDHSRDLWYSKDADHGPYGSEKMLGLWSDGQTLWAGNSSITAPDGSWERTTHIYAYDLATGQRRPERDIDSPVHDRHDLIALWSNGTTLWALDPWTGVFEAVDLASGGDDSARDFDTLEFDSTYEPSAMWSDGETLWVAAIINRRALLHGWSTSTLQRHLSDSAKIFAFDFATGARKPNADIETLAAAGNHLPRGLWSDGKTMWVTDEPAGKTFAYDLATGTRQTGKEFGTDGIEVGHVISVAGDSYWDYEPADIWSDGRTAWTNIKWPIEWWPPDAAVAFRMPESAVLYSLELDGIDLAFQPGRTSYDITVPSTTTSTAISAEAAFADTEVEFSPADTDDNTPGHQVTLASGLNTVTVTTTNGGDTRSYTLRITRATTTTVSDDDTLATLSLADIDIGTFDAATRHYTVNTEIDDEQTTLAATATSQHATLTIVPADADPDTPGHQIDLAEGLNEIIVAVTAQNQTDHRRYTVTVDRRRSSDATLSALEIGGAPLDGFSPSKHSYSVDVTADVSQVTFEATTNHNGATVEFDPAKDASTDDGHQVFLGTPLPGTPKTFIAKVIVVAEDRTTRHTYTVTINRAAPAGPIPFAHDSSREIDSLAGPDDPEWEDTTENQPPGANIANIEPVGLWSDGTSLWVLSDRDREAVYGYDLATGERKPSLDLWLGDPVAENSEPDVTRPRDIWSDGQNIYVADRYWSRTFVWSMADGSYGEYLPGETILMDSGDPDHQAWNFWLGGLWSGGDTIWGVHRVVSYYRPEARIRAYDPATGARIRSKDVYLSEDGGLPGLRNPTGMWSDGVTVWISDSAHAKIFAYDFATGERNRDLEFDTLSAAGNRNPHGLWSDGRTMWVTDSVSFEDYWNDDHLSRSWADQKIFAYNMPVTPMLHSLAVSDVDFGVFQRGIFGYAAESTAQTVTVSAVAAFEVATVSVSYTNGSGATGTGTSVPLTQGTNTITVTSTIDDDTRTYTVTVTVP